MDYAKFLSALAFAAYAHRAQVCKSAGEPYVNHLIEVAEILARIAQVDDADVLSAAVLHDAIEDTTVTGSDIEQKFGVRVRELVEALTDDKNLPIADRKRLQIEHMLEASIEVRQIKLADHCSNVASIPATWSRDRQVKYMGWSERVARACAGAGAGAGAHPELEREYQARLEQSRRSIIGGT